MVLEWQPETIGREILRTLGEFGDKLLLGPLIVAANRNDDNNVYISQIPFTITLLSL